MATQKNVVDVISQTTVPASTLTPPPLSLTENGNQNSIPAPTPVAQSNGDSSKIYTIEIPPPAAADNASIVHDLTRIVNEVYIGAEVGIWQDGFQRTSAPEIEKLIRAGELAVAYFHGDGNSNNSDDEANSAKEGSPTSSKHQRQQPKPVGCVCIQKIPGSSGGTTAEEEEGGKETEEVGEFGMLALDARHRGSGLGKDMVRFAEERCRTDWGLAVLRLELLFPTGFEHAFKVRLAGWYGQMGYEQMCVRNFADDHPHMAPLLAGPCEYRVFEKKLA